MTRIAARCPALATVACVAALSCLHRVGVAQTLEEIQAWVDERSALGERIGGEFAVEVNYTVNLRIPIDPATAEVLKRDLSAFPDHPLRGRQQHVRDAAEKGIDILRYLAAGNGRWRIAKTELGPDPTTWHSGGSGGDSWMWYGTEVTLVDASRPPHGRDYSDMRFEYLSDVLGFTTGGLADLPPRSRRWSVTERSGSGWKAIASVGEPPVTYTAVGGWNAAAGKGVVHTVISDGSRAEYTDWRERDGFWTAGVVTVESTSGYRWVFVLKDIATPPQERVVALTRTPAPGKPDLLLAKTTPGTAESDPEYASPVTLVDLRGTVPTAVRGGPDGLTQLQVVETPHVTARRHFRWAGWGIGASLAILFGAAWWWKVRTKASV